MNLVEEATPTEMGLSAPISETEAVPPRPSQPEDDSACSICLRCFAYRAGTRLYRAECIDLDIGTESESLEGAVHGLNDAIFGYLTVVLEGVRTNQQVPTAILRPSPLSHRLHYRFGYLMHKAFALIFPARDRSTRRFYRRPYGLTASHCHV
jgi:hypothetical protein